MDRIPAYVDDMGETVYADDLRAGLLFIKARCKQGVQTQNKFNRIGNKLKAAKRELLRRAKAEQRGADLAIHLQLRAGCDAHRAELEAEHIDINDPPTCHFIPETTRWG